MVTLPSKKEGWLRVQSDPGSFKDSWADHLIEFRKLNSIFTCEK